LTLFAFGAAPSGGPSATTNASGERAQATRSAAACLQKGRDHDAGHEHFARTLPDPSAKAIVILYGDPPDPAASPKSLAP
jgi:hypothetical protein